MSKIKWAIICWIFQALATKRSDFVIENNTNFGTGKHLEDEDFIRFSENQVQLLTKRAKGKQFLK